MGKTAITLVFFGVVLFGIYILFSSQENIFAADGSGTNIVSPTSANPGSAGNTFTFTFTAAETMDSGGIRIQTPAGWSAMQGTPGIAGYTTATSVGGMIADVINNADVITNWQKGNCGGIALSTAIFYENGASVQCGNLAQGAGKALQYYRLSTAVNWSAYTRAGFWIYSDLAVAAGDLNFAVSAANNLGTPQLANIATAIPASAWTYINLNISALTRSSILSYGLYQTAADAAINHANIYIDDILAGPGSPTFPGGGAIDARILQLANSQTITVVYGNGGGASGVTAPLTGVATATTTDRVSDAGTLTTIVSSPALSVNNQVPTIASISPAGAAAGGSGFTLTVNGANFISSSSVNFNGVAKATVFVSSTQLTAAISASDITTAGTYPVAVINPLPGGGTSNSQTFTVSSVADTTPPVVTAFSMPATAASLTVNITSFTATDNVGVTGYLLTVASSTPSAGAAGWAAAAPSSYTFSSDGTQTLYAWAKDAAGNVSASLSASVVITFPAPIGGGTQAVSSVASLAGGVSKSSAVFSGQAYPGAAIAVLRKLVTLPQYEGASIANSVIDDSGAFKITLEYFQQADWLFALQVKDKDNRSARLIPFSRFVQGGSILKIENIFIPPTIDLKDLAVTKGKNITVFGYAAPNAKVEAYVDSNKMGETQSGIDGSYSIPIATDSLVVGSHFIKTSYILSADKMSDFSGSKAFLISELAYPNADFNNDGSITIGDWSVFLYRWGSNDQKLRGTLDLNGDGKIDISDFSIFLQAMKLK